MQSDFNNYNHDCLIKLTGETASSNTMRSSLHKLAHLQCLPDCIACNWFSNATTEIPNLKSHLLTNSNC